MTLFGRPRNSELHRATGTAGLIWHEGRSRWRGANEAGSVHPCHRIERRWSASRKSRRAPWFQLYMWPDKSMSHKLVDRARAAGYEALVVTVDGAVSGNREYNLRNGFTIPFTFTRKNVTDVLMHPRWLLGVLARYVMTTGMPRYENYPSEIKYKVTAAPMGRSQMKNDSLNWEDLKVLRKMWPGTLILKGLAHPQDAVMAADCGCDGVVVSNHGGRNLDGSMAPLEALPEIVDAIGKRIPVLVDGGFRRGSDVVKALALGANAVFVGRSTLYGVAAGGEAGAARAMRCSARDRPRHGADRRQQRSGARARVSPFLRRGFSSRDPGRADLKLLDTARAAAKRRRLCLVPPPAAGVARRRYRLSHLGPSAQSCGSHCSERNAIARDPVGPTEPTLRALQRRRSTNRQ